MYWSRSLDELHPRVAKKARALIEQCAVEDIEIVVTCTYRDEEAGKALYALGRTKPGRELVHEYPTRSFHMYRMAFDVCLLLYGVPIPIPRTPLERRTWLKVREIGEGLGLRWDAGAKAQIEWGHFELPELTLAQLRAGKTL